LLDAAYEKAKGDAKIGSTLKGIGPAYSDKVSRQGLRLGDILSPNFKQKYEALVAKHTQILDFYSFEYDLTDAEKEFFSAVEFIKEFDLRDTEYIVNDSLKSGQRVLAEGAQGSLLDIDFGSYPFVTSSNTTAAGVCSGLGVAPNTVGEVFGIFKAYCTRVGSGPFPTELNDDLGEKIRQEGREFGATTGRPRRTGWLDLPALKYSIMLNGVTQLIMMKVDVLNFLDEVKICTHYRLPDGTVTEQMPFDLTDTDVEPIYKSFKGWKCSLEGMRSFDQIPAELADYVNYLEEVLEVPISFISTGPDREAVILREAVEA
jgi:adenylosuccinate synthase